MTKFYNVAGHVFALQMPDECNIWNALGQYAPFEQSFCEVAPLFIVKLADAIEPSGLETVYDEPTEDGETVVKLYRRADGWFIRIAPDRNAPVSAEILSTPDFRSAAVCVLSRRMRDAVFGINNALMLLYAFNTVCLDTLQMHASVVSNAGKAYLFLGRSGTGKSTHSSLWLKYIEGSELMNDDNPIVRVLPDGTVMAYGSPWSGKTACYRNVEAPVGAFVLLRQCPENRISSLSIVEAYACLYSSSSGFKNDRRMGDGLHAAMEKVLMNVPFYQLDCRPDEEAAQLCAQTVCRSEMS